MTTPPESIPEKGPDAVEPELDSNVDTSPDSLPEEKTERRHRRQNRVRQMILHEKTTRQYAIRKIAIKRLARFAANELSASPTRFEEGALDLVHRNVENFLKRVMTGAHIVTRSHLRLTTTRKHLALYLRMNEALPMSVRRSLIDDK
jgi:histone H3/H4